MEIKISPGNSKLGSIPNTSVIPVKDCGNCSSCKDSCYALKAWKQYPNVREAWTNNSELWHNFPFKATDSVIRWFRKRKKPVPYFRIHVAGDFIGQNHLDMWIHIAKMFPETQFKAFTKRFDLDYVYVPQNFNVGFSMWPGMPKPIKQTPSVVFAWVQDGTETRIPSNAFRCLNDCSICKHCWESKTDVWFNQH